ncbi:unnamed protein product [Zymoseptoria tritici ST99CH_3D1]|nr:unnamed protein product [Zymoseptoria tritici ST99CH_3D1]
MDNNIWTDESIAGANLLAKRYMKTGTTLLCILTPLIVFTILTKSKPHPTRRYYHQPLYITNAIPLVWNLSPDIMHILVHTGLKFGRFAVVPRILPNTCGG